MLKYLIPAVLIATVAGIAAPSYAETPLHSSSPNSVALPADFAPEGIAAGPGSTFYVGSLATGDIYRGDFRSGKGQIFVTAPSGGQAVGIKADLADDLLFVAGGLTGAANVYDSRDGKLMATYQFGPAGSSLLNDVVLTRDAAYFTDSFKPDLYKIPIGRGGHLGHGTTIPLSGPAATIAPPPALNLNGITATRDGSTLIVGNTPLGELIKVDPKTGASAVIAIKGLIPGAPDGLLTDGANDVWVVEGVANTLVRVTLDGDLYSGHITSTIRSPLFDTPTTVAEYGNRLALVNGRYELGLPPPFGQGAPPGTTYDVALVSEH